ncbi:MAG TPA: AI-2E family transporter [Polyangiaceae bacterium]|jgi:predicted PurR-regulated permease PerM|nr:AI-2E family transporter [Polyangiaceae bacterium]
MENLEPSASAAPPSSKPQPREALRAFRARSFHWCLALLGAAALLSLVPLWAPLLLASWMAVAFRPLHAKLAQRIGRRNRAAGLVTALLVVAALLPLLVVGLSLVGTAADAVQQAQKADGLRGALDSLLHAQPKSAGQGFDLQHLGELVQQHGGQALQAVSLVFGAASTAAVGLFVFIYGFYTCLVEGERARSWIVDHSPLERWQTERFTAAYDETGRGLLIGVGLTALLQGIVATVGYLIIGVPQALVLGLLTALAALIPSIGTGLVWAPLCIGLFVAGETAKGAAVLALGAVVSVADNFLRPLVSKHANLDLPAYLLFVAMLGGIMIFGAWGLLAGPLFVRLAIEGLRMGRERRELGQASELVAREL